MPGKSKKRSRRKASEDHRLRPLKERLLAMAAQEGRQIVLQPGSRGEVKMSEVMAQFVEPFMTFAGTLAEFERLIGLAVLAWNIALMDKKEVQAAIDEAVEALVTDADRMTREDMKSVLMDLIRRKQKHFRRYRRPIVNYEVSEEKDSYYLAVAFLISDHGIERNAAQ